MGTLTIQQVIKITKLGPIDVKCASAENGRFFMERGGGILIQSPTNWI